MDCINKYFKNLTETQISQFQALEALYTDWNSKINVISRKDIENLYEHHVLHSLAISNILTFKDGTRIMDIGCGGGFPGVPLAILFPDCQFSMVDSIGKKLKVVSEVSASIGLKNIEVHHTRVEDYKEKFDFVVSRAVMPLNDIVKVTNKNFVKSQKNARPNGWICLKGGELDREIDKYKSIADIYEISDFFDEEYFTTKKIVYLPHMG